MFLHDPTHAGTGTGWCTLEAKTPGRIGQRLAGHAFEPRMMDYVLQENSPNYDCEYFGIANEANEII